MSGGSYDYLYCADIIDHGRMETLRNMADDMVRTCGETLASQDTALVVTLLDAAQRLMTPELLETWRAQEWYRSADKGRADAAAAICKYRESSGGSR